MSEKEIRKELVHLRKTLLELNKAYTYLKWSTAKFRYRRNEISAIAFYIGVISFILFPIKANLAWAIAFIKADAIANGIVLGSASVGVVTAGAITVHSVNDSLPYKEKVSIPQKEIVAEEKTIKKESNTKTEPIFKHKYATVIRVDGTEIHCKVLSFTQDFLVVQTEEERLIIAQADVFKIIW